MSYKIFYEWDWESCETEPFNPEDDPSKWEYSIIDHRHSDTFPGIPDPFIQNNERIELVLVRDKWECWDGEPYDLLTREWAYFDRDKMALPEYFSDASGADGAKVPQRLHKEVQRFIKKHYKSETTRG